METNTTNATATPANAEVSKPEEVKVENTTSNATTESQKASDIGTVESKATTDKDNLPKGVKRRIWEQAEKIRALEAKLDEVSKTIPVKTETVENAPTPDLLEDPSKWAKNLKEEARKEILASIEQARETERIHKQNEEAYNYLLSQKEISDSDEAPAEVAEILKEPEYAHIASKYPLKAAKLAYEEFKNRKGIGSERKAMASANAVATQSVTTAQATGPKTWKRTEIESYIASASTKDEITARRLEIQKAFKEGRVK